MLTKERILSVLRESKPYLEREMGVRRIGLFGSYVHGKQNADSDVDLFVELEKNDYRKLIQVLVFLEEKLAAKVDLVHHHESLRPSFFKTLQEEVVYA